MITFVHLSDIHFSQRDDSSQFDLDQQIRRALLEDLERKPSQTDYDGILITGDVAFGGKGDEYKKAQTWLDEVYARTGTSAASTYVVPGNHDVDRDFVDPAFPLWDSHVRLRNEQNPVVWRELVATQLKRDPLHSLLAPLKAYNDFSQGYDCVTKPDELAWRRVFPKSLEDGTTICLHGLNSALVSDSGDAPGKLLVTEFQTVHLKNDPTVVDVVLCHHPPEWLMDKTTVRDALRTFAKVTLFGHEHSVRIASDAKQVQLFAGAVQPSRRDPGNWLPTYHILQLTIDSEKGHRDLVVKIHTREFRGQDFKFYPRLNDNDEAAEEYRLRLPEVRVTLKANEDAEKPAATSVVAVEPSGTEPMPPQPESTQRELIVHFFRLGTPDRYAAANEAGLLRDGDDALPPQAMWAEVFRRSIEEGSLGRFWKSVAARSPDLKKLPNPFEK